MALWRLVSKVLVVTFGGAMLILLYKSLSNKAVPNTVANIMDNEKKLKSDNSNPLTNNSPGHIANSTVPNIPANIMSEMLRLNDKKVEHDEPRLIQALQDYFILPPSTEPYKLRNPNQTDYAGAGEYFILPNILQNFSGKGFFVECGAHDGEYNAHSLYFEKTKQWNGLLVEADPRLFSILRNKHRKAYCLNACLNTKSYPSIMTFNQLSDLGKLVEGTFEDAYKTHNFKLNRHMIQLQCFPLYSVLLALNQVHVDVFVLDVEGSELDILRTIPWDRVNIKYIEVEHKHVIGGHIALKNYLEDKGYVVIRVLKKDTIFKKL